MKDERFIIQGPMDGNETLYWSNDDGWGSMDTATRFGPELLMLPLPLKGVAVLELNDDGSVKECYLRGLRGEGSN
jgi:hypothetical protein